MSDFTQFSNKFLDAVLRLKCPAGHKELLFTIVRLMNVDNKSQRALSLVSLAKFLGQDKSNISKRLNALVECNVLKETRRPGYTEARQLIINYNYSEWTSPKKMRAETKAFPPDPDLDEYERLLSEAKMQSALQSLVETRESAAPSLDAQAADTKLFQESKKSTTPVESTTPPMAETAEVKELMDFPHRRLYQPFGSEPCFDMRNALKSLWLKEKLPQKDVNSSIPYEVPREILREVLEPSIRAGPGPP